MTGNPLTCGTTVSSPLQHIKRRFQSGRAETYDLVKVKSLEKLPTTIKTRNQKKSLHTT